MKFWDGRDDQSDSLRARLDVTTDTPELTINEIITSHTDPRFKEWQAVILENSEWQINSGWHRCPAQCTGLGGSKLDKEWDIPVACRKDAHVYGPSLSKQDEWDAKPDFTWLPAPERNLKSAHVVSDVAICDAAPPRQNSPILRYRATPLLRAML